MQDQEDDNKMNLESWKKGIHAMESGDSSYSAFNPTSNALGKYQFVPRWWADKIIKFAKSRGVAGVPPLKDMKEYSSSKMSDEDARKEFSFFINNPELQEEFMNYVYKDVHTPQAKEVKKAVPNTTLDDEELKALVHFKGKKDAIRFLKEGVDPTKKGNVSIGKYLQVFNKGRGGGEEKAPPSPARSPSQATDYPDLTGRPFAEAFEEAREELKSPMFRWKGKLYTTQRADEVASKIKAAVTKEPSLPVKDGGVEDIFGGEIESPAKRASRLELEKETEDADIFSSGMEEINRMPSEELGYSPVKKKKSEILQETTAPKYDSMGFGEAFAKARKKGEKEFSWRGKPYTTKYKEEI